MNILDIAIILILIMGAIVGYKKGMVRSLISLIGTILILVLAFYLKNPLSMFFYTNLPFFNFGLTALNILLYEGIAFLIVFSILSILLRIIIKISGIIDTVLKVTLVLALPSKILGAIISFIEYYIFVLVILIVLSIFSINLDLVNNSKLYHKMLTETPVIKDVLKNQLAAINEFKIINKSLTSNQKEANDKAIEVLLKYDIVSSDAIKKVNEKNKFSYDISEIITKFTKEGLN